MNIPNLTHASTTTLLMIRAPALPSVLALGHLWFFNVPNYLAASPDALLVPREILP